MTVLKKKSNNSTINTLSIGPDIVSIGIGFNGIFLNGVNNSIELNWITHGPEASFAPIVTATEAVGIGFDIGPTINFGGEFLFCPPQNITRNIVETSIQNGSVGGFGSIAVSNGGKLGVSLNLNPYSVGFNFNIGLGIPIGPVPVNGSLGVYNTFILHDFKK